MSDKPETLNKDHAYQTESSQKSSRDTIQAALRRLHQLTQDLPQVDAVAVVRGCREGSNERIR